MYIYIYGYRYIYIYHVRSSICSFEGWNRVSCAAGCLRSQKLDGCRALGRVWGLGSTV